MIKNAKITSTMLGIEDHGIMTFFVFVEWEHAGCGMGGYALDQSDGAGGITTSANGFRAIRHILETVGVDKWEKLPGTFVRIEDEGPGGTLNKIGHIIKDQWFDLRQHMRKDSI